MKPAAALAILFLSSSLAACGGGSGASLRIATGNAEIIVGPVDEDERGLASSIAASGLTARSPFASVNDSVGIVRIERNFDTSLETEGRRLALATDNYDIDGEATERSRLQVTELLGGDAIVVVNAPNGAPTLATGETVGGSLDYAAFGVWLTGNNLSLLTETTDLAANDFGAFFGGNVTALNAMPQTGRVTYTGSAIAAELDHDQTTSQILTGNVAMSANFATRSIDGSIELREQGGLLVTRVDANGLSISGNTFTGELTSTTGHTGTTSGIFAGPQAEEIAGAFKLDSAHSTVQGSFGAAR